MRTLHHFWLSPFCRKARIALAEKRIKFSLKSEAVWERRSEFLTLNPSGEVPVLALSDGTVVCGGGVICEYLDEIHPDPPLLGPDPASRAEARRLAEWFDGKFNWEVTENLVGEKAIKRFLGLGEPDSRAVRAGHTNIHIHLDYIAFLTERRTWLAGDRFTVADISAAAHLSCVDYIGDVPWAEHGGAKDWYARVKSRPSMRGVLKDFIGKMPPVRHYADLDF